eukprot:s200_g12.t1
MNLLNLPGLCLCQASKEAAVKQKTSKKSSQAQELSAADGDLQNTQKELDAANAYYEKLRPDCVDTGVAYAERKAQREQEMKDLKEALEMLENVAVSGGPAVAQNSRKLAECAVLSLLIPAYGTLRVNRGRPRGSAVLAATRAEHGIALVCPGAMEQNVAGLTDRRFEGQIVKYLMDKGFGFIRCQELRQRFPDRDIFVHQKQLGNFKEGENVSFGVFLNRDGKPQATELAYLNGSGGQQPAQQDQQSMQHGMQSGNQQYGNQQYSNQQYGSQQYGNQQYGNQQYGNQQYGNQQYGNQQYGNQQYGSQQYGNQYGNQQYGNQYGNQQYGNQYGNQQYGNQYGNQQGMQAIGGRSLNCFHGLAGYSGWHQQPQEEESTHEVEVPKDLVSQFEGGRLHQLKQMAGGDISVTFQTKADHNNPVAVVKGPKASASLGAILLMQDRPFLEERVMRPRPYTGVRFDRCGSVWSQRPN